MNKQITNNNLQSQKKYRNLEERTLDFSKRIIRMCKSLRHNTVNRKLVDQCLRSGASVGANYREANEALGKKDFLYRIRVSRKEAKETSYWLELIIEANQDMDDRIQPLLQESIEIRNILSSILDKSTSQG
jgi:four helix bundle protein